VERGEDIGGGLDGQSAAEAGGLGGDDLDEFAAGLDPAFSFTSTNPAASESPAEPRIAGTSGATRCRIRVP
jgi:hypothetical protein